MATTTLFGREWTERELRERVSDMSQLASVQRSALAEGKARGAEQVQLTLAGGFALTLSADRCLDVGAVSWCGVPLASITPPRTVGAAFAEEESPTGFARSFGAGLVYTCGLTGESPPGSVPGCD